jgi:hypothetical protein
MRTGVACMVRDAPSVPQSRTGAWIISASEVNCFTILHSLYHEMFSLTKAINISEHAIVVIVKYISLAIINCKDYIVLVMNE